MTMELTKENIVLKKDAVRLVKKRLLELLEPEGFTRHPKHRGILCRERSEFIDCMSFRTDGYHLELVCATCLKITPYVGVHADWYAVSKALPERSPELKWRECVVGQGPFYYKVDYFEKVWDDVAYAIRHCLLQSLAEMDLVQYLPLFIDRSKWKIFEPDTIIGLDTLYYQGMMEAVVFGLGSWRQGNYEEGLTYLTFAREKLTLYLAGYTEENSCMIKDKAILRYLDDVLALWESKPDDWVGLLHQRMDEEAQGWMSHIF